MSLRLLYLSVPARYAARRVAVRLTAMTVQVLDGPQVVAVHERAAGKYAEVLILDHYLEVLKYNPAPCLARPRWPRPARSPPAISGTGTPPAAPAVMLAAPGR